MEENNTQLKETFILRFRARVTDFKCPACGLKSFSVEGPFSKTIQNTPGAFVVGGPAIPTMGLVCKNCGYISEFALGLLGLLNTEKDKDEK